MVYSMQSLMKLHSIHDGFTIYIGSSIAYRDASSRFVGVSSPVFLDRLSCTGQESFLLDCRGLPLGLAECDVIEVAGVQCTGTYVYVYIQKIALEIQLN